MNSTTTSDTEESSKQTYSNAPLTSISSLTDRSAERDDLFPLPNVPEYGSSPIPISRWTKPTFIERNFGKRKPQNFYFNFTPESLTPFELNLGDLHYRWVDGFWFNLGTDYEAACVEMTEKRKQEYIEENEQLRAEIEILLDLNTDYEMKKAHLREKLQDLEDLIRSYPGVMDDSSD
ncbi:hypothetical protein TVAG_163660 [Trichomonas vaginalis G3]|uniref:Uncharacterized protein n=1 Tax=Trichomonas vaginalis (strain ATCC PRA-98 / G3) TaxID=412133 RepID=A2DG43_TRIV3|nr:Chibby family [Trichomonas vaginalis G3]EAY20670.1 hypothetical protein TVAG_163660 [Trichomonas vaginalis G3]KAI5487391.1 Chibby family [Trichomonas vaginalis G3]|eukprot:XP_001581656.1 hypothetical protein [Trichomonas vaginalis G3]